MRRRRRLNQSSYVDLQRQDVIVVTIRELLPRSRETPRRAIQAPNVAAKIDDVSVYVSRKRWDRSFVAINQPNNVHANNIR
ncbi:MAG: hypothetical protein ACXVAS_13965 [Vulcanimicrobiaceae bacterium]